MKLWTVRAGKRGEQEQACLNNNVVAIGWNELPDISKFKTKKELVESYRDYYPETPENKIGYQAGQVWRFANEISIGDLVALPSKFQPEINIGKVTGNYRYTKIDNLQHIIPVKWLKAIPRSAFDQDLLYSFGSLLTVSQVNRSSAIERIMAIIDGQKNEVKKSESSLIDPQEEFNIERYAKDQITKVLDRKFKGHGLTDLVNQILRAQGYTTQQSPEGADGGVDILAASGPLGFEQPRICVQVKSTTSQVDVKVLRELQGVMNKFKAQLGLIVSWSGFNQKVISEAKNEFFYLRLWNADDLLDNIFKYYEGFTDEFKAELPLKRVWTLVSEED